MPHVSFIMPAYNCAGTIAESVASIMETNFRQGDELVIVNDFSSDGTASVIESLQEVYPVIKAVHHPRNRGGGVPGTPRWNMRRIRFCSAWIPTTSWPRGA